MKKVAILGDSISQGIGSRKINYFNDLQLNLGSDYEIKNFACTGTTINYAIEINSDIEKFNPDIIIIMYGNVDAQLRPNLPRNRYKISYIIPKRYKQNGMLDPRPFYSKKWFRYIPDRVDNIIRKIIRNIIIKTQGVYQFIGINEFEDKYQIFINNIKNEKRDIFLISTIKLDDLYYKGSIEEYEKYNMVIEKLAINNNSTYIDLFNYIDKLLDKCEWEDIFYCDHYHPNKNGYKLIAELLSDNIKKRLDRKRDK